MKKKVLKKQIDIKIKNKKNIPYRKIILTSLLIVIITLALYIITKTISNLTGFSIADPTGSKAGVTECLKQKDITLFINSQNPMDELNKIKAQEILTLIKIVNCNKNTYFCSENLIAEYPTYVIETNKIVKDLTYEELVGLSGC